ncbi:uncharacterized protein V2V93DRAFT_365659 [Kockiozyma suomiensis]|uniref:uncharacterized protein n=1 Tax=Kockiozyma suomiensis TaxID=1337062 RepID=UPI003343B2AB
MRTASSRRLLIASLAALVFVVLIWSLVSPASLAGTAAHAPATDDTQQPVTAAPAAYLEKGTSPVASTGVLGGASAQPVTEQPITEQTVTEQFGAEQAAVDASTDLNAPADRNTVSVEVPPSEVPASEIVAPATALADSKDTTVDGNGNDDSDDSLAGSGSTEPAPPLDNAPTLTTTAAATADDSNSLPLIGGKPIDVAFLMPLSSTHFNFCRSLYTALMNDYPKPTLVNWGKRFKNPAQGRVHKISGIDQYLHRLSDDKFAFILDGYDVWYQIPYRDFLSRFVESTKADNHEVVVFGADKKCWPNEPDSAACVNVPKSPLPTDVYGPQTDKLFSVYRQQYINFRPRWLNSGNIIGPVQGMREIYDQANYSITHAPPDQVFSDQMYIAEIYGEQKLKMTVDFTSELFQTMTFSHKDITFLEDDLFTFPRKAPEDRRWYAFNRVTSKLAPILHFNGPKEHMDEWWPKMWWYKERENPAVIEKSKQIYETGGAYDEDGNFISWSDLCMNVDVNDARTGKILEDRKAAQEEAAKKLVAPVAAAAPAESIPEAQTKAVEVVSQAQIEIAQVVPETPGEAAQAAPAA